MPLADARQLLTAARAGGYALPAFNVNNLEFTQAVVAAAADENAPVIVEVSEAALEYGGAALARLALEIISAAPVPVVLHLDHGSSFGRRPPGRRPRVQLRHARRFQAALRR